MDLRSHYPFSLLQYGVIHTYPSLQKNIKKDVVIIGAGISGALAAWHLCKQGIQVVVVDKRHAGMGSTAASSSLLQYEIDTPLFGLSKMAGEKNAVRSYKLCIQAIDELEKICSQLKTDTGFTRKESLQYASFKKDVVDLKKEFDLRKQHGIDVQWVEEKKIKERWGFKSAAGIFSTAGGQVDAYRLTHALLAACTRMGAQVYDSTTITAIEHQKKGVKLTTQYQHTITANHLVIAAGYESQKYIPKKIEQLHSTYAIVSEPFTTKNFWYHNSLIWETATPYLYLRTTSDNRILVGGKDEPFISADKRDEALPHKAKLLEKSFHKLFPHINLRTDYEWAGTFASTKDGLPYIGAIPQRAHTYFALGFGGNGITFSVIAAQIITDLLSGKKNKDAGIFSFNR